MKILHLCASDTGGSGTAALRLHRGLMEMGLESKMLVKDRLGDHKNVWAYECRKPVFRVLSDKIKNRFINNEFWSTLDKRPPAADLFSDDRTIYRLNRHPWVAEAELIHLHWVAGFVDHADFMEIAGKKPVVWTLHDMNPFTGGCYFSKDCRRYESGCGACPELGSNKENDLSAGIWKRKARAYRDKNIFFVAPSRWLAGAAKKSALLRGRRVSVISYGLPENELQRKDRHFSRELLKITTDKPVILFGASDASNPRKGFHYLREALKLLKRSASQFALAVFGSGTDDLFLDDDFEVYFLRRISDERLLPFVYSAADIFVIPSLADNLPNAALEAMACSVPVVGFEVGGIKEIIRAGENGLLARPGNVQELAGKIAYLLENFGERKKIGSGARNTVESSYTLRLQAEKYAVLYRECLR